MRVRRWVRCAGARRSGRRADEFLDEAFAGQALQRFQQLRLGDLGEFLVQLPHIGLAVDLLQHAAHVTRENTGLAGGFHQPLGRLGEDASAIHVRKWGGVDWRWLQAKTA